MVGNPPWGGAVDPAICAKALSFFGISEDGGWDSWELFLLLGIRSLREGGRLALVLPDSFLYPKKSRIRKLLFEHTDVEKVHNLGPDWFGSDVRMGTVVIQARRGPANSRGGIKSMILSGKLRTRAIRGQVPLTQIESQRARSIPTTRVLNNLTYELEVFRGVEDDRIIGKLTDHSNELSKLCRRARGEELNKAGLIWIYPSCLNPTTPGDKTKGGGFKGKNCERCSNVLTSTAVDSELLVSDRRPKGIAAITFIDGDDINRRYVQVKPRKWLRLGVPGWKYKHAKLYVSPKLLVRQAGVGISATFRRDGLAVPAVHLHL